MSSTATNKFSRYAFYGLLGLLTFVFFVTGGAKVIMADFMITNMAEINFGLTATVIIGIIEVLAVPLLWIPRYRTLALSIFLLMMAGAAGAHWGFGHPPAEVIPSFIIAGLTFTVLWMDRGNALWDFVLRSA